MNAIIIESVQTNEDCACHCYTPGRYSFWKLRDIHYRRNHARNPTTTASAIKCSYVLHTKFTQHKRHAEPRKASSCLRVATPETSSGTSERPRLGKLDRCIWRELIVGFVTASGIATATTTLSREVAATTCHSNFNRMQIRDKRKKNEEEEERSLDK